MGPPPPQPVAHVTNQLLLQEWQPGRRGRVASPGWSRKKEELETGMANSESTECFSFAARSSRVDLGQGRVGRNMTYFLRLPLQAGSGGQGAGAGLPVGNRGLQGEAPRPHAACARRHRRKENQGCSRRTQSQSPARVPGPGRTRGRRPGRALHLPPAHVPAAEGGGGRARVPSGNRPVWPRRPQPPGPRELGRSGPSDLGARPPGFRSGRTLSPQLAGRTRESVARTHLPASPVRSGGATLRPGPHRPPQPTPQAAAAVAAAAAGRERRDGGQRQPRRPGPTRLRPAPSVPPTGRHRRSSLARTTHASAQPRPAA